MNYTENYQLPQWEKSDRIMMEDFNDMAGKMEAGLTKLSETIAGVGYVIGKYTGNGRYPRTISLDFQPAAVIIAERMGMINHNGSVYGGVFGKGFSLTNDSGTTYDEVTSTGFKLGNQYINANNYEYYYIAFK